MNAGRAPRYGIPYADLIREKTVTFAGSGIASEVELHPTLFDHQAHTVRFALRKGRAAAFLDTGLGKTACALEWGRVIFERENRPVLMLAPLAVGAQHVREAQRLGIDAVQCREGSSGSARIDVANYERLDKFDPNEYAGVILDESSILKSFTGSTSRALRQSFERTPYRLACTATPAPNDYMELGQHCDFLGVMPSNEMLSRWFIADQSEMGRYRLKRAAVRSFWDWVGTWSRCASLPSDLGFSDEGFVLPELEIIDEVVECDAPDVECELGGQQVAFGGTTISSATTIHRDKRRTLVDRAQRVAEIVAREPDEPWLVWVDTNYEADALTPLIPDAVEVRGGMSSDAKEEALMGFTDGKIRVLITKPSIAGFGLNWQHCARQVFIGPSFSYEATYQALRRCWRFGQKRPVRAYFVMADSESHIRGVQSRKAGDHADMKEEMREAMRRATGSDRSLHLTYQPQLSPELPQWIRPRL